MRAVIEFCIKNTTYIILGLATAIILCKVLFCLFKKEQIPTLSELIIILLNLSGVVTGIIIMLCSIFPEYLTKIQGSGIYIFIAGLALIYVMLKSLISKNGNGDKTQDVI